MLVNAALTIGLLIGIEFIIRLSIPSITPLGTSEHLIADSVFGAVRGPRPRASGLSNGARFRADSRGFWRYSGGSGSARPKWLLIGDSVTMGIGVPPDSTFAGILARRLSGRFEILNPSMIGYASHHYRALVHHFLETGHPGIDDIHRLTLFWCINDPFRGQSISEPKGGLRRTAEPLLAFARRHFYTYQWLKATFFDRPKRYYLHDAQLYQGQALDDAVSDLEEIARLCERSKITCEVVLLPYEYQLRERLMHPQNVLASRLADLPLHVYDATTWMWDETRDPSAFFLYGDGIHLSKEGHRRVAGYVLDIVEGEERSASDM